MRFAALFAVCFLLAAQAPDPSKIKLRGDRFHPLSYAEMTTPQKTMVQHILSGERTSLDGPFNVLLRSPEMGDLAQQFGASMRFHSSLPRKLNELAIIVTARYWTSQYEWYAHRRAAHENGLSEEVIQAIAQKRPPKLDADELLVYTFCTEMLNTKQISDATFTSVKNRFGERGIVDLIGVMGYYQLVSMALNADRYPLPEGVPQELR